MQEKPSSAKPPRSPLWRRLLPLLPIAATLLVYAPVFDYPMLPFWDDDVNVHANPYLTPSTLANLKSVWTQPYVQLYVPVSYSAWMIVAWSSRLVHTGSLAQGPLDPAFFHGANVLLHALASWAVYHLVTLTLRRIGRQNTALPALAGSLLFALHPLQVEPVAWVSGLRDVLGGSLFLLALLCFMRWGDQPQAPAAGRSRAWWLATFIYSISLGAKPAAVALPAVALLGGWAFLHLPGRRIAGAVLPWFAIAAAWSLLTRLWAQTDVGIETAVSPPWARPLIAADSVAFYMAKVVQPWPLLADYGRSPAAVMASGSLYWMWLAPAIAALLCALWRPARPYLVALVLFGLCIAPVSGLVPFNFQSVSTVADRYAYTALFGAALALAMLYSRFPRIAGLPVAAALAVCVTLDRIQLPAWSSGEALVVSVLRHNPESWKARHNYGFALDDRGAYQEAIAQYREAIRLCPGRAEIYNDLGVSLSNLKQPAEAAAAFEKALALRPTSHAARNLGIVRLTNGEPAKAREAFALALKMDPTDALAAKALAEIDPGAKQATGSP
jgi:protein O-mannosyl-transferase